MESPEVLVRLYKYRSLALFPLSAVTEWLVSVDSAIRDSVATPWSLNKRTNGLLVCSHFLIRYVEWTST